MWQKWEREHEGDPLKRTDWFIIRTEPATKGVTLVLVDFPAGSHADPTRCEFGSEADAQSVIDETVEGLKADGWTLAP